VIDSMWVLREEIPNKLLCGERVRIEVLSVAELEYLWRIRSQSVHHVFWIKECNNAIVSISTTQKKEKKDSHASCFHIGQSELYSNCIQDCIRNRDEQKLCQTRQKNGRVIVYVRKRPFGVREPLHLKNKFGSFTQFSITRPTWWQIEFNSPRCRLYSGDGNVIL
jgi:hypothetical protein